MHRYHSRRFIALLVAIGVIGACDARAQAKQTSDPYSGLTARTPDAFYDPPARMPSWHGALLRSEPLQGVTLPTGMRGWRILYTTSVNDGTPATAVATVIAPMAPLSDPRPVIAWEHGTTGLAQRCMPSLISAPAAGMPALDLVARSGWVIVATDYSFTEKGGPHPYLIGEGEARAGLDSVRAARQMSELSLDPRTVVWGHSQGGHAALWTGIIGPDYAPEVRIVGVAAIAPAADITSLLSMNVTDDKLLGPYVARSYSRFYPGIAFEKALRPEALSAAREMVKLCAFIPPTDPQRIEALAESFKGRALAGNDQVFAARLAQNAANGPIDAPLLIAQGLGDTTVPPAATNAYVGKRCAAGQRLDYWKFAGVSHSGIVEPGTLLSEPLVAWTAARFANRPQANGCARKSF